MNKLKVIGLGLAAIGFVLTQAQSVVSDKQQEQLIEKKVKEQLKKQREEA